MTPKEYEKFFFEQHEDATEFSDPRTSEWYSWRRSLLPPYWYNVYYYFCQFMGYLYKKWKKLKSFVRL